MKPSPDEARERTIRRVLTCMLLSLAAGGLGWSAWQSSRTKPSLTEAIRLASAGRLEEAEAKVRARLTTDPDDGAANLLFAQIVLKKAEPTSVTAERAPSPIGQRALDHLDRVRPENPSMAVLVQLCRGNALNRLFRFDEAEAAWKESLRIDPTAPEAGWNLLTLYYIQGRLDETRRLALRLYRVEPDPHDRALLLLELLRPDARPPAPGSLITAFKPIEQYCPGEFYSALTLGLARIRANQVEEGIEHLRNVVRTYPDRVEAWDCLLMGLDESGQVDMMEEELSRLPAGLRDSPRLLKHRGRICQDTDRWDEAVDLYRRAQSAEPHSRVVEYRLSRALRRIGKTADADRIDQSIRRREAAVQELRALFDRATAIPDLGIRPYPELCQQIADARERMQFPDESAAWHRLVLGHDPENEISRAALARLEDGGESR